MYDITSDIQLIFICWDNVSSDRQGKMLIRGAILTPRWNVYWTDKSG